MLMPVVYVSEMARSVAFYEALGGEVSYRGRSGTWTELRVQGGVLALHSGELSPASEGPVALSFVATEPLESLARKFEKVGLPLYRAINDEAFGRSLTLQDPDGLLIQINEHDEELYT